jgi:hypothetical protein
MQCIYHLQENAHCAAAQQQLQEQLALSAAALPVVAAYPTDGHSSSIAPSDNINGME